MPKWQYCAVIGLRQAPGSRKLEPFFPAIWYFTPNGLQIVEIKGNEEEELAKAIAKLGEEGWELVSGFELPIGKVSQTPGSTSLTFRRDMSLTG